MKINRLGRFMGHVIKVYAISSSEIGEMHFDGSHVCRSCGTSVILEEGDMVIQQAEALNGGIVRQAHYATCCQCGTRIHLGDQEEGNNAMFRPRKTFEIRTEYAA